VAGTLPFVGLDLLGRPDHGARFARTLARLADDACEWVVHPEDRGPRAGELATLEAPETRARLAAAGFEPACYADVRDALRPLAAGAP
jgi:hypothetical protein